MTDIVLQNLSKVYEVDRRGAVPALSDIHLSVAAGELLAVTGPSGSGKTTLLRLIAGLEEPTSGSIRIEGKSVDGRAARDRDVGMVFQQPTLYPHLSVKENLSLGLRLRHLPAAEIAQRVAKMACLLGLETVLDRKPDALSGGQQQRVSIGRTLVRRPRIFLLDEPLSHLDPSLRNQLRREFRDLQRQLRVTTLYVTHDQGEALSLGDRIAVLAEGRLQQVATPLEIYHQPLNLSVARLIGSPPMNLIPVETMTTRGSDLCLATRHPERAPLVQLDTPAFRVDTSRRLLMGIRPEHLTLFPSSHPKNASALTTSEVESVEFHGAFEYVQCRIGYGSVACLSHNVGMHQPGDPVAVQFNPERVLLFDEETGERLGAETPANIKEP